MLFFVSALIECNLDAGKKNDAAQIASAAATFIKQNVPHLYKQVFGLIVSNSLFHVIFCNFALVKSYVWIINIYPLIFLSIDENNSKVAELKE
jgi:hypothetical protein